MSTFIYGVTVVYIILHERDALDIIIIIIFVIEIIIISPLSIMRADPSLVKRELYSSLKNINNLSVEEIANLFGYKSKQSVYNLFSSNRYLPLKIATKLEVEWGYNADYLTTGNGSLYPTTEDYLHEREYVSRTLYLLLKGCFRDVVSAWGDRRANQLLETYGLLEQYFFSGAPGSDLTAYVRAIEQVNNLREEIVSSSN